jgi:TonB-dependent SusC/RagA subfamily outer membrane receptor
MSHIILMMKMKIKIALLILLSSFCLSSLTAQKNKQTFTIKGSVVDVYRSPIANAIVMVDGQKTDVVTNSKGYFKIKVPASASSIGVLTFGNGIIEQSINGRNQINFNFKTASVPEPILKNPRGEEGVNVGYSSVKRKNLTTDVSNIDGRNPKYSTYASIYEMIEREVSGVKVNGDFIVIQGSRNMYGEVGALLVVDGVSVNSISNITPVTVKSISVLKGSSASIYGSRGFGGAVVITTKLENDY